MPDHATFTTRLVQHVNAPRAAVYRALLDPAAVARWMVPDGMTAHVHTFDVREGGAFRVSLTYDTPTGTGKTTAHGDTYHGHFLRLVPDAQVIEAMQFETADVAMRGQMTVTFTLVDAAGGTDVEAVHDNVPAAVVPAQNELGWRMALGKLARLVESRPAIPRPGSDSAFDVELKRRGGLTRLLNAVGYSAAGLRHAIRHEASIREALLALVVLVPVALLLPVSRLEQLLLVLSLLLVVTLELFNSAIEAVVDRISMERHPLSGQAKDMASAAVAIAMLMTGITWIVIAGPVVWNWLR